MSNNIYLLAVVSTCICNAIIKVHIFIQYEYNIYRKLIPHVPFATPIHVIHFVYNKNVSALQSLRETFIGPD